MTKLFRYVGFFSIIYATLSFIVGFNHTRDNGFTTFGLAFISVWPITVFLLTTAYLRIKDEQEESHDRD